MQNFLARPAARHGLVLLAYSLLALLMTFPLVLHLGTGLLSTDSNALNDTYFSLWVFGWQAQQLIADPLNLFQGNIFYPFQNTLAFSEIILPGALLYLPIEYATANPIFAYNIVLLITFPLNAFAMYVYALDWFSQVSDRNPQNESTPGNTCGNTWYAALLAGLIFGFCTYKMGELRHVHLLLALFMPLTLMYVARFMRTPSPHNAFFTALFFALNALASLYYALFLTLAVLLYVGIDVVFRRFRLTRAHFLYGVVSVAIAVIIVLPFLLPFLRLEREFNFSEGRDPRLFSARPASYLASTGTQWLYGTLTRTFYVASKGQPLFPGIVAVALGFVGLAALIRNSRESAVQKRAWIFLSLLALMGVILSFGPDLLAGREQSPSLLGPLPYLLLARFIPPLKSLNAPARFVVLTMLALSLLAAYGMYIWMQRAPRGRNAIALGCAVLIVLEYIPIPLRVLPVEAGANISLVYTFLAQQPRGQAVVELPMGEPTFADQDKHVVYTYNSLYHLQPLVNGYSTFIPPDYYTLVKDVGPFPGGAAVRRLKKWGAQWFVVHSDQYKNAASLRKRLSKRKALEHIRDFGDIWLYRVRDK